jgi:GMP synthase-like glutamine amidotransferase
MRSLIVRFIDSEGPGILGNILKENGYAVTYQNAYQKGLQILPESHLNFDLIVLMGGPQSVADPQMAEFFKPYFSLVENCISMGHSRMIGVCLGSQIIAQVLGSPVRQGELGAEVGFSECKIVDKNAKVFKSLKDDSVLGFHLHEDTYDIPKSCTHLLSTKIYPSQMFSYDDRIYGIQTHLEPSSEMIHVWKNVHKNFIEKANADTSDWIAKQKIMEDTSRIIFQNMIQKEV